MRGTVSGKRSCYSKTLQNILKLKDRFKMVVTCMLLLLLVSNSSVSAWITWYTSTHDYTTPGASDSNEIGHHTNSSTSVPGMFTVSLVLSSFGSNAYVMFSFDSVFKLYSRVCGVPWRRRGDPRHFYPTYFVKEIESYEITVLSVHLSVYLCVPRKKSWIY